MSTNTKNNNNLISSEEKAEKAKVAMAAIMEKLNLERNEVSPPSLSVMTVTFNPKSDTRMAPHGTVEYSTFQYPSPRCDTACEMAVNDIDFIYAVEEQLALEQVKVSDSAPLIEYEDDFIATLDSYCSLSSFNTSESAVRIKKEFSMHRASMFVEIKQRAEKWTRSMSVVNDVKAHLSKVVSETRNKENGRKCLTELRLRFMQTCMIQPKRFLQWMSYLTMKEITWPLLKRIFPSLYREIVFLNAADLFAQSCRYTYRYGTAKFLSSKKYIVIPTWSFLMFFMHQENIEHIYDMTDAQLHVIALPCLAGIVRSYSASLIRFSVRVSPKIFAQSLMMSIDSAPMCIDLTNMHPYTVDRFISSQSNGDFVYFTSCVSLSSNIVSRLFVSGVYVSSTFSIDLYRDLAVVPTTCGMEMTGFYDEAGKVDLFSRILPRSVSVPDSGIQLEVSLPDKISFISTTSKVPQNLPLELTIEIFRMGLYSSLPVLSLVNRSYYHMVNKYVGTLFQRRQLLLDFVPREDYQYISSDDLSF